MRAVGARKKIRVLGYMVNFGASWGTWSVRGRGGWGGGVFLRAGDLEVFLKNFWGSEPYAWYLLWVLAKNKKASTCPKNGLEVIFFQGSPQQG